MKYKVKPTDLSACSSLDWLAPPWDQANSLTVGRFHTQSSSHRPVVQAKLLYDPEHLYVMFRVEDRYVRSVHTEYQGAVCRDSCVEFFVEPVPGKGYFNFESNAGGTLHLSYIEDPRRGANGFAKYEFIPQELGHQVRVKATLPEKVDPEIKDPITWLSKLTIPLNVFRPYVGELALRPGVSWRANFYKCADDTSHPHWATWAPIGEQLNFHQPRYFAPIEFV